MLEPFAAWDGEDFCGLPVLLKAQGKCTTDHISMAGPWLRYRGHLENISGNLYLGAVNAFTGAVGEGKNQLDGSPGRSPTSPPPTTPPASAGLWWATATSARVRRGSTPPWSPASGGARR